ncbi:MAG: hypothetical protein A2Y10_08910 [Planctomycetes bacterium GWF2_41_51]|nr:MAG: hypothetical protein A2Y10_08910 [Planctomycetes bacterium GWF2_41_51]HBG26217.1 hypothetical protein [Phycisphaerales bacterium]
MNNPQDITVLEKLTNTLEGLNIAYAIGGSMASSAYGIARFTQDADITVEPFDSVSNSLFDSLKNEFYISKDAMLQALKNRTSFNVIHLASAFKIDIFVRKETAFQIQMFAHSRKLQLGNLQKKQIFVSPEDVILLKLDWYKQSDCVSDRQWSDIIGVLSVQKNSLDYKYLKTWSANLGLNDLLQKAISESNNL